MMIDLLPELRPSIMYKAIYREIAKSWANAENLTLRRQNELLDEDRMPMNGEEESQQEKARALQECARDEGQKTQQK
jgi:hypothetical protein